MPRGGKRRFGSLVAKPSVSPTPFVKWAGGKTQLLSQMERWFPEDHEAYFEPFMGGGAVFFHLLPGKARLADLNEELMNVYQVVKSDVKLLMKRLDEHKPKATDEVYYYETRDGQDPKELDDVSRAARTVFLNKTCYNGLYRVNSKGQFNVPFGRYKNPRLYDRGNLIACSQALKEIVLATSDYKDLLTRANRGDFIYLDPPYQPLSKTANFTSYTKNSFSEVDQKELAKVFSDLDNKGCKVMLSNSATELVRSLYDGFNLQVLKAKRAISSNAQTRGAIDELLIMNYEV